MGEPLCCAALPSATKHSYNRDHRGHGTVNMRVLHIITSLTGGGAERFVAHLAPTLATQVAHCGVMTIYPTAIPNDVASSDVDVLQISRKGRYEAAFLARMVSSIRAWRPDVVHTHMKGGTYWGRLTALLAGVPAIVRTEHLPCDVHDRVPGTALADRFLNANTTSIVTFFREQAEFLARYENFNPSKIAVIPNGIKHGPPPDATAIADGRKRLGVPPGFFSIVVLGNLHRHKNQRLALQAFAAMSADRRRHSHLYFLGEGDDRIALTAMAHDLGLNENVTFLGFRNDVLRLLPGADLALVPSTSEGMPLAMIEEMSAGVPIVSTPWLGAKEMLAGGDLGLIAQDWTPSALAKGIERVFDERSAFREKARAVQAYVREEYDIGATARRHVELYERLLVTPKVA